MKSDDDIDRRAPDEDEGPVTPAEQAHAEAFGRLVDGLLAGEPMPPAMDSDARALVETATMVVASHRPLELDAARTRRLIDRALENAVLGRPAGRTAPLASVPPEDFAERSATDVRVRRRRRDRAARALPWAVASLAAAAAIVLFIVRPSGRGGQRAEAPQAPLVELRVANTSRPADPLIGVIPRDGSGKARERIDILFADRMAGYRDLSFRRALPEDRP